MYAIQKQSQKILLFFNWKKLMVIFTNRRISLIYISNFKKNLCIFLKAM